MDTKSENHIIFEQISQLIMKLDDNSNVLFVASSFTDNEREGPLGICVRGTSDKISFTLAEAMTQTKHVEDIVLKTSSAYKIATEATDFLKDLLGFSKRKRQPVGANE